MRAHLQSLYHSKFHPSFVSGIYPSCASCLPLILVACFLQRKNKMCQFFRNEEITEQFPNMSNGPIQEVYPKADTFRHKWSMPQYAGFGSKGCCSKWTGIDFHCFIISLSFFLSLYIFLIKFAVICLLWAFFFYTHHFEFRLQNTVLFENWDVFCFAKSFVMYKLTGKQQQPKNEPGIKKTRTLPSGLSNI